MKKTLRTYAEREYGIKPAEMKIIAKKLHAKVEKDRAAGKFKTFSNGIEALLYK